MQNRLSSEKRMFLHCLDVQPLLSMAGNRAEQTREILLEAVRQTDEKALECLFTVFNNEDARCIKSILEQQPSILTQVCRLGFVRIVELIVHSQFLDLTRYGRESLQACCFLGHVDLTRLLLEHGVQPGQNVWEEDSEFYVANLNGHVEIVDMLYEKFPEYVMKENVRYCLMYAACQGGHLALVKKWISAITDVNSEVEFVASLSACENQYPLFTVCSGEHMEVALFLLTELNANFTEAVCRSFPDFTRRLILSNFVRTDERKNRKFEMSDLHLFCLLPSWFIVENSDGDGDSLGEDFSSNVTLTIDVSKNKLKEVPHDILWSLDNVVELNVSHNPLLTAIADPVGPVETIDLSRNSLTSINLSNCHLTFVSAYIFTLPNLEKLNLSHNYLESLVDRTQTGVEWKCGRLLSLDISHNSLGSLPAQFGACGSLKSLKASHNKLTEICSPWQCPMKHLDLCHNYLESFPPSADQFWSRTLNNLDLSHNHLKELAASIVRLSKLTRLDVSDNKIQDIPSPSNWKCPLIFLNMHNNNLGATKSQNQQSKVLSAKESSGLEFPGHHLASSLSELYLSQNNLRSLPMGVCSLSSLSVLDIGHNSALTELPYELGMLRKLLVMKTDGLKLKDKELQSLVDRLNDPNETDVHGYYVVNYLERQRRKCVNPNVLKMVVLGCKNQGGHCIVKQLVDSKPPKNNPESHTGSRRSVSVQVWELPALRTTATILPCFLTLNSLYLLIHDATVNEDNLKELSETISCIQACVVRPTIIILCIYSDAMDKSLRASIEQQISAQVKKDFHECELISMGSNEKPRPLQQKIQECVREMCDATVDKKTKLMTRLVPSTFLAAMKKGMSLMGEGICSMKQFLDGIGCQENDLEDFVDRNLKLQEFLLQSGAMLHYNNSQGDLCSMVIVNPGVLFRVLSQFLESLIGRLRQSQLPLTEVRKYLEDALPSAQKGYFETFIVLLEVFNIGIRIPGTAHEEIMLVPSLLPDCPPALHLASVGGGKRACRLYHMPSVPAALWSHVIIQLISAFERFSNVTWNLGSKKLSQCRITDKSKSFRMSYRRSGGSMKGLHIMNKNIQYWQTGIMVIHGQGFVVVEQIKCCAPTRGEELGILITVQTTAVDEGSDSSDQLSEDHHRRVTLERLAVIGIVKDEVEEVLELFHPKFRDPSGIEYNSYALCPRCCPVDPGRGSLDMTQLHFLIDECAQMVLSKNHMVCERGPISLEELVPELFFSELPSALKICHEDIEISQESLGRGMTGSVHKGKWKDKDVAIKVFYARSVVVVSDDSDNPLYPNMKDAFPNVALIRRDQDRAEAEQRKISNAFSEMRREVGILSKLKHSCIIAFIGVCVRPKLLVLMELAPLGSLRKELDKRRPASMLDSEGENAVDKMVFSKHLTYKIILQMASGLSYLHMKDIIYRDLKPDNVLVMSMDLNVPVNVKLSDYGISKFATVQGLTGLFGTVGYMAPEVAMKETYTNKIDIFSFSMVMIEVVMGIPPAANVKRTSAALLTVEESVPLHIKNCRIHCNFPYMEELMGACWALKADQRPRATEIMERMKRPQFLLLHDLVWMEAASVILEITCVYACETMGRWNIWICEAVQSSNKRYLSVYDMESSCFTVLRQEFRGPAIVAMVKVEQNIWVACKNSIMLEVIVRGPQSKFEMEGHFKLPSEPTGIHKIKSSKGHMNIVFVGLVDGNVHTICNFLKKSVTTIETVEVQKGISITSMCSVSDSVLAVACGKRVTVLDILIRPEDDKCNPPEFQVTRSVDLTPPPYSSLTIAHLVCDGRGRLWCSFKDSSVLFELNLEHLGVVGSYKLLWDPKDDKATLALATEKTRQASSVSDERGLLPKSRLWDTMEDNVFKEHDSSSVSECGGLTSRESEIVSTAGKSRSLPRDACVPSHDRENRNLSDGCQSNRCIKEEENEHYHEVYHLESDGPILIQGLDPSREGPPPIPPRTQLRRRSAIKQTPNNASLEVPASLNDDSKQRSRSVPGLLTVVRPPPLIPRKKNNKEQDCSITSLLVSKDTLLLGTESGSVCVLSLADNVCQLMPCPCALLRHRYKPEEAIQRGRSPSSVSNVEMSHSGTTSAPGVISSLVLAHDKVVSLHKMQAAPELRLRPPPRARSRLSGSENRSGSVFDEHTLDKALDEGLENGWAESSQNYDSLSQNVSGARARSGTGVSLSPSMSSWSSQLSVADANSPGRVADLAVWDNISSSNMDDIVSYAEGLE
ncbi:leucine-rich repeat serine/threonine-protein kinase 1 isoform X2 [Aplysia californica]|uniref:non-specific serine/threonine protein kinase n=1 Tax=Aplysia californica TaxID=6500 RepID=A0ABM1W0B1_APLCA|nr:leucine-rich repeat serine/threonine-protein kinase 1 isoform X2 [Aplysia californica]